ncbi:MAG TPA: dynamin family protein [Planctomycetota bacterium]|nr:dynamin family protein [Planctomycetota bacterium]
MQQLLDDIALSVQRLYREAVDPLSAKFAFEKRPDEGEISGAPTVLFLGNHSSGKSTFINHLLGTAVQKTGLAPTDDAFTVLSFGGSEEERDGQAVVSTPTLPYGGLKNFGPQFLSHFKVKSRPQPILRGVTLIDSPGMIDSPGEGSGRGFDFAGAVRWFAERADVVLVFFDPEKPGTTGETLQVFMQSLRGMDHKLLIVLNKMDRFESLTDFARAYGALCWNLGKVIPRKDLPHIFTTFIPVEGAVPSKLPTQDFVTAREELVAEVKRAPARRADNLVTQLEEHAQRLLVHSRVIDEAGRTLRSFRLKLWAMLVVGVLFAGLAGAITIWAKREWWISATVFGSAALLAYVASFVINGLVKSEGEHIVSGLTAVFERLYARELLVRDRVDDLRALWDKVHPRVKTALEKVGILAFPKLSSEERDRLSAALEKSVPELRQKLQRELSRAR